MKKILVFVSLLLMIAIPFNVTCEDTSRKVFDEAKVFSPQQESALSNQIAEFEETYGLEFSIVTTRTPHKISTMDLADNLYDSGKYGVNPNNSGFLFLLDLSDSAYALSTCGKAVDYYNYSKADYFESEIITALRSAKSGSSAYADACSASISIVSEIIDSYFQYDIVSGTYKQVGEKAITKTEILVTALIAISTGLILSLSTLSSYKLKGKTYHYEVDENARVKLTKKEDTFIRTVHTRTRIASNYNSGGGHGGISGGSRPANTHFSSGGFRHGGSSGHF